MTAMSRRASTAGLCSIAIAAVTIAAQSPRNASTAPSQTTLGVAAAVNATPSLAVDGRTVAAVWTASKDGAANVYVATSTDSGATFSQPRRVNDVDGDATA